MPAHETPSDIRERTFRFGVRVLRLVRALPRDPGAAAVARQLARSGAGVGANVEEAQGSHSRREFERRKNIARSEAREALYWLRMVDELELVERGRVADLLQESDELVRIPVTIVRSARLAKQDP